MSTIEKQTEELLERLLLEIKAFSLLYGSDAELKARLEGKIIESHDESVRRFVSALQMERRAKTGRLLGIALGELLVASLLVVAGTVVLVPNIVGISTYAGLVQYFSERLSGPLAGSPLSPYLSLIEFGVGVILMLSAFFALREAALNLKQAGLAIRTGETSWGHPVRT